MIRALFHCTKNNLTSNVVQSIPQKPRTLLLPLATSFSSLPHPPSADPNPHFVNQLCRILSDHRNLHHDIESALHPFAPNIDPISVEHVLRRCKFLGFSAHRFFIWAQNLPNFKHTRESFHILVSVLGLCKMFPLLWDFLGEVKRTQLYQIDSQLFLIVFRAYSRADLPADAIRAYNKMAHYGIKPTIDDLDELLLALCERSHVKHAQEFFDKVKNDFAPDAKSYSILIRGWGKIRELGDARRLYDEMIDRGCPHDLDAYNSVLECLCRGGNVDEAYELFTNMESMGLKADACTYSIFIHASCRANDIHSVIKILDRMRRYNLVPSVFTYNDIINSLCKSDMPSDAYQVLNEMIENGVRPNVWSYNSILACHAEYTEVNCALRLISKMDKESCNPDRRTYNILLKLLIRMGRYDRVNEVWDSMEKRGFYPGVPTYSVMINGFLNKRGKLEEACKYFEMMIDEGLPPYVSTCHKLRYQLVMPGFYRQADALAEKMERSTSRSIQELSSIMRGIGSSEVSQNEEFSNRSDYDD